MLKTNKTAASIANEKVRKLITSFSSEQYKKYVKVNWIDFIREQNLTNLCNLSEASVIFITRILRACSVIKLDKITVERKSFFKK